jgi:catechol 2,3-dioxygenase-like lactoylglutathione lyase family enzyme
MRASAATSPSSHPAADYLELALKYLIFHACMMSTPTFTPPLRAMSEACVRMLSSLDWALRIWPERPRRKVCTQAENPEAHWLALANIRRKSVCASVLNRPSVAVATAPRNETRGLSMIEGISAVTLGTHEMPRAVRFYRALGFEVLHGGEDSSFTSFRAGTSYLNLVLQPARRRWSWWGRVIFYVADVDELYDRALAAGFQPATVPRDAEWGERFFHLIDPDGHELSFARLLRSSV